jgi:quercetin dioxygenase-like cupin family protein
MEHLLPEDSETSEPVEDVHAAYLIEGNQMSSQHFEMNPGAVIPEHDHSHEQIGFVYEGEITLFVGDDKRTVSAGEGFFLPGGESHEVENTGETIARGVDIFSPPRPEDYWSE